MGLGGWLQCVGVVGFDGNDKSKSNLLFLDWMEFIMGIDLVGFEMKNGN